MSDYDFWGDPEAELLSCTDPDEAIENIVDNMLPSEMEGAQITVVAFRCRQVTWFPHVLETVLEQLDDEYGGEEGTKPTEAMKAAETAFIEVMRREYKPWLCEPVPGTEITVNALEWVREHMPEWFENDAGVK